MESVPDGRDDRQVHTAATTADRPPPPVVKWARSFHPVSKAASDIRAEPGLPRSRRRRGCSNLPVVTAPGVESAALPVVMGVSHRTREEGT
jgi:hypothetical protein